MGPSSSDPPSVRVEWEKEGVLKAGDSNRTGPDEMASEVNTGKEIPLPGRGGRLRRSPGGLVVAPAGWRFWVDVCPKSVRAF